MSHITHEKTPVHLLDSKGVRAYTFLMTSLPHHSPAVTVDPFRGAVNAGLVIDWPENAYAQDAALSEHIGSFVGWVGTLPRRSSIHVRLPCVRERTSLLRLQRTLLTMGCTVTCRTQLSR